MELDKSSTCFYVTNLRHNNYKLKSCNKIIGIQISKKMKATCIIVFVLISMITKAQKLKIHVTEVIDVSGFDSTILDLINNEIASQELRSVNSFYDLDLTEKTFRFFKYDELISEGEIAVNASNGLIKVNFMSDEYEIGLLINPILNQEQIIWFGIFGEYKEICKFKQFEIIKSL